MHACLSGPVLLERVPLLTCCTHCIRAYGRLSTMYLRGTGEGSTVHAPTLALWRGAGHSRRRCPPGGGLG